MSTDMRVESGTFHEKPLSLAPVDFRTYFDLAYEFDGVPIDPELVGPEEIALAEEAARKYGLGWPPNRRDADRTARLYRKGFSDLATASRQANISASRWQLIRSLLDIVRSRMGDIAVVKWDIESLEMYVAQKNEKMCVKVLIDIRAKVYAPKYLDVLNAMIAEFPPIDDVEYGDGMLDEVAQVNVQYEKGRRDNQLGHSPQNEGDAAYMSGYLGV